MDDQKLIELIDSIREIGQIEPIHVEVTGARFRIHAGHRRWVACGALDKPRMLALVYQPGQCDSDAIQMAENAFREEVNPVDEGRKFERLLERKCSGDIDKLCAHLKMKRQYVEGRLLLLAGDTDVTKAVEDSAINLGVAQELNRVKHDGRRKVFLDAAIRSGATIRTVRSWRIESEPLDGLAPPELPPPGEGPGNGQTIDSFVMRCLCCQSSDNLHDFELFYIHRTCKRLLLDNYLANLYHQLAGNVQG